MATELSTDNELLLHRTLAAAVDTLARTYLARRDLQLQRFVGEDRPAVSELSAAAEIDEAGADFDVDSLVEQGVDRALGRDFANLGKMARVADLAAATRDLGRPMPEVYEAFEAVDAELGLRPLETHLRALEPASRWERWQVRALFDDLARLRRQAAVAALSADPRAAPARAVADWLGRQPARVQRFARLAARISGNGYEALCLAGLAVRALSDLVEED